MYQGTLHSSYFYTLYVYPYPFLTLTLLPFSLHWVNRHCDLVPFSSVLSNGLGMTVLDSACVKKQNALLDNLCSCNLRLFILYTVLAFLFNYLIGKSVRARLRVSSNLRFKWILFRAFNYISCIQFKSAILITVKLLFIASVEEVMGALIINLQCTVFARSFWYRVEWIGLNGPYWYISPEFTQIDRPFKVDTEC